jgi:TRAP-type transport system periplasmic protein
MTTLSDHQDNIMNAPHKFTRRAISISTLAAAAFLPLGFAHADQTIKLTIAASHPTTVPWVGLLNTLFVPEVTKRVTALNKGYKIEWREAYGGQLYKINATLSSVSQGITDIGWVFHNLEPARLPLQQFGTVAPFTTDDVSVILDVANELNATLPALKKEWERNNAVYLGGTAVDTYHLFTKQPVKAYSDLNGRKLSAPGAVGLWLRGSGAVAVDGALTTYYTDMQSCLTKFTRWPRTSPKSVLARCMAVLWRLTRIPTMPCQPMCKKYFRPSDLSTRESLVQL